MSEQHVREIPLGVKQLVFLFLASVVLAVAIFLLGISVGRGINGVSPESAAATEVALTDAPARAEMPPATKTTPADLSYHDQLQGQAPAPPASQARGAGDSSGPGGSRGTPQPESAETPPAGRAGSAAQRDAATPASAVSPPATGKPPVSAPEARPAPSSSGWFVQVAAFKSRENADRQATELRAKGYAAGVLADPGSLFRVRVGPFPERAEADRALQRLQREEGIRASVQR
jgi:cell division septation protein DedD